jgi:hypothetical protein
MSKIKTPRQKKQLSLERDRRNAYREDSKASRKNIARGKQRRHMDERRAVAQVLSGLKGKVEEGVAANAELHRGFRKVPDEPPGVHLILHARNRRNKGGTTA